MNSRARNIPPAGWSVESLNQKNATYVNEHRGLQVEVRGVLSGSRVRKHDREPSHYVVQLRQDWYAKGTMGEREMGTKAKTWEEALDIAEKFMAEFEKEVQETPAEEIEATHRAVGDSESAEQILTSAASAEALADAAGYSDDLLREVLDAEVNGQYLYVVHRDGDELVPIDADTKELLEENLLPALYAAFPIDKLGVEHILVDDTPIPMSVHLGEYAIYRFIFSERRETDIVLPAGTQVTSPAFERTISNVLEEKW